MHPAPDVDAAVRMMVIMHEEYPYRCTRHRQIRAQCVRTSYRFFETMTPPPTVPLEENRLFRYVPKEDLREQIHQISLVGYEAGQIIFEAGDVGDVCYLIERGSIRISARGITGGYETVATLGPGDFFGELGLVYRSPRSARATALEDTRLGRVDEQVFERLKEAAPLGIVSALAEANMQRVRATNQTLIQELTTAGRLRDIGSELITIGHNLRRPVATMVQAADLLREFLASDSPRVDQISKYVEIIYRTGKRALGDTEELLARLRGERQAEWTMVAPADLVATAEQQVGGLVIPDRVRLATQVHTTRRILVQRVDFEAALVNLIRNALEALPAEGGSVTVKVTEEERNMVFSVADTGQGIPPEHRGRLFDPQFTYGKSGGTGLGLPHVKRVAEEHLGRVEVRDATSGPGAEFRIVIPVRAASVE